MPKSPKKTLKEYAADAAARLKKSPSGTTQLKKDEKKLSKLPKKGK
jgi:hypothetical protein